MKYSVDSIWQVASMPDIQHVTADLRAVPVTFAVGVKK